MPETFPTTFQTGTVGGALGSGVCSPVPARPPPPRAPRAGIPKNGVWNHFSVCNGHTSAKTERIHLPAEGRGTRTSSSQLGAGTRGTFAINTPGAPSGDFLPKTSVELLLRLSPKAALSSCSRRSAPTEPRAGRSRGSGAGPEAQGNTQTQGIAG